MIKWRKLIRDIHRDLGYFFFGASIIYGLSGIALNHMHQWNPSYIVETNTYNTELIGSSSTIQTEKVMSFLSGIGEHENYKKHYAPSPNKLKIFIKGGSIAVNLSNGEAYLEKIKRRPIFHQFNFLHYNHSKRLWTWFADLFAISLVIFAITGLFMVKGKKGLGGRGKWYTLAGIILPAILFFLYRS